MHPLVESPRPLHGRRKLFGAAAQDRTQVVLLHLRHRRPDGRHAVGRALLHAGNGLILWLKGSAREVISRSFVPQLTIIVRSARFDYRSFGIQGLIGRLLCSHRAN
jgi:hypothetical protein